MRFSIRLTLQPVAYGDRAQQTTPWVTWYSVRSSVSRQDGRSRIWTSSGSVCWSPTLQVSRARVLVTCESQRNWCFFHSAVADLEGGDSPPLPLEKRTNTVTYGTPDMWKRYCIMETPLPLYLFKHVGLKHGTQNNQNICHQCLSDSFGMDQIYTFIFRVGLHKAYLIVRVGFYTLLVELQTLGDAHRLGFTPLRYDFIPQW